MSSRLLLLLLLVNSIAFRRIGRGCLLEKSHGRYYICLLNNNCGIYIWSRGERIRSAFWSRSSSCSWVVSWSLMLVVVVLYQLLLIANIANAKNERDRRDSLSKERIKCRFEPREVLLLTHLPTHTKIV